MIERPIVGEPQTYKGHLITVHYLGPDLLVRVDGAELPSFYMTAEAARSGGTRYVDQIEKEAQDKAARAQ